MSAAATVSLDQTQIADLLLDAIEASPVRRQAILKELREASPNVAREVERLLECHLAAGDFMLEAAALPEEETPSRALASGDVLGERFLIEQFLGAGGFGEVYLALDQEFHRRIAIKTILPEFGSQPEFVDQLKQEIQIAQAVSHPNLCRLYDLERASLRGTELVFITMEWISGPTLSAMIKRESIPEPAAAQIALQVLSGLAELHRRHIIHRDLKTSNIMLAPEADGGIRAVITDFGLARMAPPGTEETLSLLKSGWVAGTPAYMAPEQLRGKKASIASDLHAIGVILFELRAGRLPFVGDSPFDIAMARLENTAPSVRQFNRTASTAWEQTIAACLEQDIARRPASANEVAALLLGKGRVLTRRLLLRGSSAAALAVVAYGGSRWVRSRPDTPALSPAALRSMQLGAMFLRDRSKQSLTSAVEEFSRVAKEYPRHATAWAGLAEAHSSLHGFGNSDSRDSLRLATEAGKIAIELEPNDSRAAAIYACNLSINVHRWLEAEPYFKQAIAANPEDSRLFNWYGAHLGRLARFNEAIGLLERGAQRYPDDLSLNQQLATELFRAQRMREFEATARELVRLFFDKPITRLTLARALEWNGKFQEAEREIAQAERLGWEQQSLPQRITLCAARGNLASARPLLAQAQKKWSAGEIESMQMAIIHLVTGNFESAVVALHAGFDREDSSVLYAPTNPYFAKFRQSPEIVKFVKRLGLPG